MKMTAATVRREGCHDWADVHPPRTCIEARFPKWEFPNGAHNYCSKYHKKIVKRFRIFTRHRGHDRQSVWLLTRYSSPPLPSPAQQNPGGRFRPQIQIRRLFLFGSARALWNCPRYGKSVLHIISPRIRTLQKSGELVFRAHEALPSLGVLSGPGRPCRVGRPCASEYSWGKGRRSE